MDFETSVIRRVCWLQLLLSVTLRSRSSAREKFDIPFRSQRLCRCRLQRSMVRCQQGAPLSPHSTLSREMDLSDSLTLPLSLPGVFSRHPLPSLCMAAAAAEIEIELQRSGDAKRRTRTIFSLSFPAGATAADDMLSEFRRLSHVCAVLKFRSAISPLFR